MLLVAPLASADTEAAAAAAEKLEPMLREHCYECHGPDLQEGELDFAELLSHRPLVRDREIWRRAIQLLEMAAMPPEHASTLPSKEERAALLAELDQAITKFDYSTIDDPGFVPMRRLSHREYNNTIRDLFGVDLKPADRFPSELTGATGFDNSANTLFLQPALMERYIGAAERIIDLALPPDPTSEAHHRTRKLIFVMRPEDKRQEHETASQVLRRFLLRAYRRPPTDEELSATLARYEEQRVAGQSFEAALKKVFPSILISPKFLLRVEAGQDDGGAHRINDWELASRLSYFLWATMPDDELFKLAEANELHDPAVLSAQVKRMLADPKAESLGDAFAAQWLNTQLIGNRIRLDPIDYPWCTDTLMDAMRAETSLFFMALLRENRRIDELISADFTFVNEELANTLYRIDGIEGPKMRRVALTDNRRGGILTQPGVLAVTSTHTDTSPVKRGIFVLDTLLGTPPPPPPPDAGELDPKLEEDDRLTFREKLEQHASGTTCRACHATMDPVGFAMENFDYFGRWRKTYRGKKAIDASGVMPDGTILSGPESVKEWILNERRSDLVRQTSAKMLAYALGRNLEYYDEPALQKMAVQLEIHDFRFQMLLHEIVTSYPFQYRKEPEGPSL